MTSCVDWSLLGDSSADLNNVLSWWFWMKKVDSASSMSRDTFHLCHYATNMKADPLDDGMGNTLVSRAFDDVTFLAVA
jgi:hypothetical protein